jgi:hypothetical protein
MSEAGHRYTFGFVSSGVCSRCGSSAHWTLHCPERDVRDEREKR